MPAAVMERTEMLPTEPTADVSEPPDLFALFNKLHCFQCGQWKEPNAFRGRKNRSNGVAVRCLACQATALVRQPEPPRESVPASPAASPAAVVPVPPAVVVSATIPVVRAQGQSFAAALDTSPDFASACRFAASVYRRMGNRVRRECEVAGIEHDAGFWFDLATDAEHAAQVYATLHQECPQTAQAKMQRHLRKPPRNMDMFIEALETGEYGACLGW